MRYNRLGDTGLIVSRLAFGAMTFGSAEGTRFAAISRVDQKLATELVAKALDAGINHFNTADVYAGGESERMLGKSFWQKHWEAGEGMLSSQRRSASGAARP